MELESSYYSVVRYSTTLVWVIALVIFGAISNTIALFGASEWGGFGLGFVFQFVLPAILLRKILGPPTDLRPPQLKPPEPRWVSFWIVMAIMLILDFFSAPVTRGLVVVVSWAWAAYVFANFQPSKVIVYSGPNPPPPQPPPILQPVPIPSPPSITQNDG